MVTALFDAVALPFLAYGAILVLLTVDAFIPIVPTQALMIGGGMLAAAGQLQLVTVVAAGALGAFAGDLLAFGLGRRLARRDAAQPDRVVRKQRAITRRLTEAMRQHVFLAILFCRFVPAGRMVTSMHAGRNGYSARRFMTFDLVAATLWASYAALLGHLGGEAIASSSWLPLLVVAALVVLLIAGAPLLAAVQRFRRRGVLPAAVAPLPELQRAA